MKKYSPTKYGIVNSFVRNRPGKTQAEVNAGVLERALKAKPDLKLCANHVKLKPAPTPVTVEELRWRKANRVTGTKRFKTAI